VALFDVTHHGMLEATGSMRQLLHNLCTNDVLHLAVGAAREAFFATGQAKIVGHALIDHVRVGDGGEPLVECCARNR